MEKKSITFVHDCMMIEKTEPEGIFRMNKKQPIMLASIARIIATALIFIFHYRGLNGLAMDFPIDKLGIFIFVLVSGFFSYQPNKNPSRWLIRRIKQIMIPYWLVISIVLSVNSIIHYKDTTILKNIIIFFGGSLFVDNPVYVISWFITYILILYFCVFVLKHLKSIYVKLPYLVVCGYLLYVFNIGNLFYFIGFFSGYILNYLTAGRQWGHCTTNKLQRLNTVLYYVQNYSYSFFLIHAGILQLIVNLLGLRGGRALISSIVLASVSALLHKTICDTVLKISNRSMRLHFSMTL